MVGVWSIDSLQMVLSSVPEKMLLTDLMVWCYGSGQALYMYKYALLLLLYIQPPTPPPL
jgi:hypothetical protein